MDPSALPRGLEDFLSAVEYGFSYYGDYNMAKDECSPKDGLLYAALNCGDRAEAPYSLTARTVERSDPLGRWGYGSYFTYESEQVDEKLKTLFNCSDDMISSIKNQSRNPGKYQTFRNAYYDNGLYYYNPADGYSLAGVTKTAEFDGARYYLTREFYSEFEWEEDPEHAEAESAAYILVEPRTGASGDYWSLLYWSDRTPLN